MIDERWILSCYGLLSFLKSSIHYVHLVYYVQIFISIYRIDLNHFWFAECLFLIWNTLNDPFFGWISDRYISSIHHRLEYLSVCTPLLCLSSLLFWYPWMGLSSAVLGLQLLISLCLYDTFLTIIDLNCNSLLIDIPDCRRERLSSASAMGNALGRYESCRRFGDTNRHPLLASIPLLISYLCWKSSDMRLFRIFVTGWTMVAMCGSVLVTRSMKRRVPNYLIK